MTLKIMAGDCEDQTILLASLLESVGKRCLLAFTRDHVYPVVCFDDKFNTKSGVALKRAQGDAAYRELVFGAGGWSDQKRQYLKVERRHCFPLEPTVENAYVGYPHDLRKAKLVDPVQRRYVPFGVVGG